MAMHFYYNQKIIYQIDKELIWLFLNFGKYCWDEYILNMLHTCYVVHIIIKIFCLNNPYDNYGKLFAHSYFKINLNVYCM